MLILKNSLEMARRYQYYLAFTKDKEVGGIYEQAITYILKLGLSQRSFFLEELSCMSWTSKLTSMNFGFLAYEKVMIISSHSCYEDRVKKYASTVCYYVPPSYPVHSFTDSLKNGP